MESSLRASFTPRRYGQAKVLHMRETRAFLSASPAPRDVAKTREAEGLTGRLASMRLVKGRGCNILQLCMMNFDVGVKTVLRILVARHAVVMYASL
jgi:hypothetical protein